MRREGTSEERINGRNEEFKNTKKKEVLRKVREDGNEGRLD